MRKIKSKQLKRKLSALILCTVITTSNSGIGNLPRLNAAANTFSLTSKVTIGVGENYKLKTSGKTKGITFSSSNKKIVSVNKKGIIKGKKKGSATIFAKVNKKRKKCKVTVKPAPKAIKITNGNLKIEKNSSEKLSVRFTDGYSKKITYSSKDKSVAIVSSTGIVTAVGKGSTTITAKTFNGKKATISCEVIDDEKKTPVETPAITETVPVSPIVPIESASAEPSMEVTINPTIVPTQQVTAMPTIEPTQQVTAIPTIEPTQQVTAIPTIEPTQQVTAIPTVEPTTEATVTPTTEPTTEATVIPTIEPTQQATVMPTITPTPVSTPNFSSGTGVVEYLNANGSISLVPTLYGYENVSFVDDAKFYKSCDKKGKIEISKQEIFSQDEVEFVFQITTTDRPVTISRCTELTVTQSDVSMTQNSAVKTFDENERITLYDYSEDKVFVPNEETKAYKNGEEICYCDIKQGDPVRISYSSKENGVNLIKTIIVLSEDKLEGWTTSDEVYKIEDNLIYLSNGTVVTRVETYTRIKKSISGQEYVMSLEEIKVGDKLTVTYEMQSGGVLPLQLENCKKIVVERNDEVPPTPTEKPNSTKYPTPSIQPMKPVIYLYPKKETEVSVKLDFNGSFTYTYPYTSDGQWEVIAQPDGTLTNKADNLEYSYLFWEGTTNVFVPDFSRGFCVKGEDITEFFQKVLPQMGLTPREYNEFIVYWAPILQNNPYNLISFQTENYEQLAPLHINPLPDSMLRVYMAYKPLANPVEIQEQTFEPFERKGFTVVEWGGCSVE